MSSPKEFPDLYYAELQRKYDAQLKEKYRELESNHEKRVADYRRKIMPVDDVPAVFGILGVVLGIFIGIVLFGLIHQAGKSIIVSLIAAIVGVFIGYYAMKLVARSIRKSKNETLEGYIREAGEKLERDKDRAREQSRSALEAEHLAHVRKIHSMADQFYSEYIDTGIEPPIIPWLEGLFDKVVQKADHFRWIEKISPSITLTVNARTAIARLSTTEYVELDDSGKPQNKQPDYSEELTFNYVHERMDSPITASTTYEANCQRAAYARFLARVCTEYLRETYPKDPNATKPVKPDADVAVLYGAENVRILYTASNTQFIPV